MTPDQEKRYMRRLYDDADEIRWQANQKAHEASQYFNDHLDACDGDYHEREYEHDMWIAMTRTQHRLEALADAKQLEADAERKLGGIHFDEDSSTGDETEEMPAVQADSEEREDDEDNGNLLCLITRRQLRNMVDDACGEAVSHVCMGVIAHMQELANGEQRALKQLEAMGDDNPVTNQIRYEASIKLQTIRECIRRTIRVQSAFHVETTTITSKGDEHEETNRK